MNPLPAPQELEKLLAESEWVGRLASSLVGNIHDAEDLVQETWLAALRRPPHGGSHPEGEDSRRPWLATVTRNAARFCRRSGAARRARESAHASQAEGLVARSPEELLERLETQEQLSQLVRGLAPELAEVLLLTYYEGRSPAWIAEHLGLPGGTVRWRKKRALELLRERLDARHGGDRERWLGALAPLAATSSRRAAEAAKSGGLLAGLLTPWLAMSLALKLVSLLGVSLLAALLFLDRTPRSASLPPVDDASALPVERLAASPSEDLPRQAARSERRPATLPAAAPTTSAADPGAPLVTRLRLHVVDELGRPVSDARVTLSPSLELQLAHRDLEQQLGALELLAFQASLTQRTDADGRAAWETDLLHAAGLADFEVLGPRYETGSLRVEIVPGMDEDLGELVLATAGAVAGRLRTSAGATPARWNVELGPAQLPTLENKLEELASNGPAHPAGEDFTDADGAFLFTGVAPGEYRVYVHEPRSGRCSWSQPLVVERGQATEGLVIEVDPPGAKAEILVLGADGEPLDTARVVASLGGSSRSGSVRSDGTFDLGAPSTRFASGRAVVSDGAFAHREAVVDPLPLTPGRVVVQLEAAATVEHRLTLVGTDGSAVQAALISVVVGDGARTWSEVDGPLELVLPAPTESPFDLAVSARGFAPLRLEGLAADALPADWSVELEPLAAIEGIVLVDGEPLERAKVALRRQQPAGSLDLAGTSVNRLSSSALDELRTGRDGRFRLFTDVDGDLALVVSARRMADRVVLLPEYRASAGRSDLVFELDAGGTVEGRVFDHLGAPLQGASVVLDHPLHSLRSARTRRDGSFKFRRVPAGDWYLRVVDEVADGFFHVTAKVGEDWEYPANCAVRAGELTRQDLVSPDPRDARIAGRVRFPGVDPGPVTMTVYTQNSGTFRSDPFADDWERETTLDENGDFAVPLRSGRDYVLKLEAPELASSLRRTVPRAELPAYFDAEFALAHLTLYREGAEPTEAERGVLVSWRARGWSLDAWLTPEAGAPPTVLLVPAGSLEVSWESADGESHTRQVELAAGAAGELTLD